MQSKYAQQIPNGKNYLPLHVWIDELDAVDVSSCETTGCIPTEINDESVCIRCGNLVT